MNFHGQGTTRTTRMPSNLRDPCQRTLVRDEVIKPLPAPTHDKSEVTIDCRLQHSPAWAPISLNYSATSYFRVSDVRTTRTTVCSCVFSSSQAIKYHRAGPGWRQTTNQNILHYLHESLQSHEFHYLSRMLAQPFDWSHCEHTCLSLHPMSPAVLAHVCPKKNLKLSRIDSTPTNPKGR